MAESVYKWLSPNHNPLLALTGRANAQNVSQNTLYGVQHIHSQPFVDTLYVLRLYIKATSRLRVQFAETQVPQIWQDVGESSSVWLLLHCFTVKQIRKSQFYSHANYLVETERDVPPVSARFRFGRSRGQWGGGGGGGGGGGRAAQNSHIDTYCAPFRGFKFGVLASLRNQPAR